MTLASKGKAHIIRTDRGLAIAGTRITLYDVMDYAIAQSSLTKTQSPNHPPKTRSPNHPPHPKHDRPTTHKKRDRLSIALPKPRLPIQSLITSDCDIRKLISRQAAIANETPTKRSLNS